LLFSAGGVKSVERRGFGLSAWEGVRFKCSVCHSVKGARHSFGCASVLSVVRKLVMSEENAHR
jgi:hypothetical protein